MVRTALALVLLLPLAVVAQDKKDDVFHSKEGKFSIAMPSKPTENTTKVQTDLGKLDTHMFLGQKGMSAYLVFYSDYPKGSVGNNAEKVLEGVVSGNVKGSMGKLLSDQKMTIGKNKIPARQILVELTAAKQVYRSRVFLVGDRLYQVAVSGSEDFVKGKEADAFLDSFRLDE